LTSASESCTSVTVAVTVSVSPGHTCDTNRAPNRVTLSAPNMSVTTRPVIAIVSIPCAKTLG
jgi:hypothetical protein